MKKIFTTLAIAAFALQASAQVYVPDGTPIAGTFALKDLSGNTEDLFTILGTGKHLVIDLSATWCGPCWNFHESKVLDNYYDEHGANGTKIKDAQVYFVEVDVATTAADLNGTTSATQGDWVTGTTHPIMDCQTAAEKSAIVGRFVNPNQSYGIPALFVVCADKKLYKLSTSTTTSTALRTTIEAKCGLKPLSANEIHFNDFSFDLAPNPATSSVNLQVNLQKSAPITYTVYNLVGQSMVTNSVKESATGVQSFAINTQNFANGLYVVKLQVGKETTTLRFEVTK